MENLTIGILYVFSIIFIGYFLKSIIDGNNNNSHKMFVEYIKASKSKNLEEYVAVQPEERETEQEAQDEMVDLDQLPPEKLLSLIRGRE